MSIAVRSKVPSRTVRVLMVTPRYFPEMGGVENHVYQVAGRLTRSGVQVTVLTTDRNGDMSRDDWENGVCIHRVRAWPAKRDYYFAPEIYSFIQRGTWDLVHIQSYHTLVAPLAMLAARRANLPYVLTFHGGGHSSRLRNAGRGIQLALLRPMLAQAERLVTLAHFERKFYSERLHLPEECFALIPNGADLPKPISQARRANHELLIASIGRLERYKGHQKIIAALPAILKEKPDLQLWIAGNGPFEPELRSLAKKLDVEEHIRFQAIPADDRERMAKELMRVSLVVLLSEYETHPIAILEALAMGCPALVTDTSGLGELCEQGLATGIPVDSSSDRIASAVLAQLRSPSIPRKLNLPSWDDCAHGLLDLYTEISTRLP